MISLGELDPSLSLGRIRQMFHIEGAELNIERLYDILEIYGDRLDHG
jgi:hypothetical protein